MNIPNPTPVQRWITSDKKEHDSSDVAVRHEQFLVICNTLNARQAARSRHRGGPLVGGDHYDLIMALLDHFDVTAKA